MCKPIKIIPTELFTGLSHETRLRCLMLLKRHGELCVCELTHAIDAVQPHISRHLSHLKSLELIVDRREGHWIYYKINSNLPIWVNHVFDNAATGISDLALYEEDSERLINMLDRPDGKRCS